MTDMSDVITALGLVHQVLKTEPNLCVKHHECRITAEKVIGAYRLLSELAQRGIVRTGTTGAPKAQLQLPEGSDTLQREQDTSRSLGKAHPNTPDQPGELTEPEWAAVLSADYQPEYPVAHSKKLGNGELNGYK